LLEVLLKQQVVYLVHLLNLYLDRSIYGYFFKRRPYT
jgi:hypothetical protein